jgi:hypothetical protein
MRTQDAGGEEGLDSASPPRPNNPSKPPAAQLSLEQAIPSAPPTMQMVPIAPVVVSVAATVPTSFVLADALSMPSPKVICLSKRTKLSTRAIPYVPLTACQGVNFYEVPNQIPNQASAPTQNSFSLPPEFQTTQSQDVESDCISTSAETAGYYSD